MANISLEQPQQNFQSIRMVPISGQLSSFEVDYHLHPIPSSSSTFQSFFPNKDIGKIVASKSFPHKKSPHPSKTSSTPLLQATTTHSKSRLSNKRLKCFISNNKTKLVNVDDQKGEKTIKRTTVIASSTTTSLNGVTTGGNGNISFYPNSSNCIVNYNRVSSCRFPKSAVMLIAEKKPINENTEVKRGYCEPKKNNTILPSNPFRHCNIDYRRKASGRANYPTKRRQRSNLNTNETSQELTSNIPPTQNTISSSSFIQTDQISNNSYYTAVATKKDESSSSSSSSSSSLSHHLFVTRFNSVYNNEQLPDKIFDSDNDDDDEEDNLFYLDSVNSHKSIGTTMSHTTVNNPATLSQTSKNVPTESKMELEIDNYDKFHENNINESPTIISSTNDNISAAFNTCTIANMTANNVQDSRGSNKKTRDRTPKKETKSLNQLQRNVQINPSNTEMSKKMPNSIESNPDGCPSVLISGNHSNGNNNNTNDNINNQQVANQAPIKSPMTSDEENLDPIVARERARFVNETMMKSYRKQKKELWSILINDYSLERQNILYSWNNRKQRRKTLALECQSHVVRNRLKSHIFIQPEQQQVPSNPIQANNIPKSKLAIGVPQESHLVPTPRPVPCHFAPTALIGPAPQQIIYQIVEPNTESIITLLGYPNEYHIMPIITPVYVNQQLTTVEPNNVTK